MSAVEGSEVVIEPERGTRRFRRNARLAVVDGILNVTDRRGRTKRFAIDGSDEAPARYEVLLEADCWVILDARGQALVTGDTIYWDRLERNELIEAAGIPNHVRSVPPPPPPLRSDGVKLEDSVWPFYLGSLGPAALGLTALTRFGVLPGWLGLSLGALVLLLLLSGLTTGILSGPRRGKGWAGERRSLLEGVLKIDRIEEARRWGHTTRLNVAVAGAAGFVVPFLTFGGSLERRLIAGCVFMVSLVAIQALYMRRVWRKRVGTLAAAAEELDSLYAANPGWVRKAKRRTRKRRSPDP